MIEIKNLCVTYHGAPQPALSQIDLSIKSGNFTLICGATGSGKSTLLQGINGILHHESSAHIQGELLMDGIPIQDIPQREICKRVGTVFQNPAAQLCRSTPEREIAFGMENLGVPSEIIKERIDRSLEVTGLQNERHQNVYTLSGGQQQRLAIAAALAFDPDILLLDEPISQLDSSGAEEILNVLCMLKDAANIAVVLVEHRLEGPLRMADQVVVMERGCIARNASPTELLQDLFTLRELGLQIPPLIDLFERLQRPERPLTCEDAPELIQKKEPFPIAPSTSREPLIEIDKLDFSYSPEGTSILKKICLRIDKGNRIAILGTNGSGKTTLLHLLAGSLTPSRGAIRFNSATHPEIGLVMQNPDVMLISETVQDELLFAPRQQRIDTAQMKQTVQKVIDQMSLSELKHRAPFSLSRGERQRTAVGSVLTQEPTILLLDEPTTGQDRTRIDRMMHSIIDRYQTVIFSTHDVETAARHADRVVLLYRGEVVEDGPPERILFDFAALKEACILPSQLHLFAHRHDLCVLNVQDMVEVFR